LAVHLRPLPKQISASIIRFHAVAEVGREIRFGVKKKDFLRLALLRMTRSHGTSLESSADGGAGCCGCIAERIVLVKEEKTNGTRLKRLLGPAAFPASTAADPIHLDSTPVALTWLAMRAGLPEKWVQETFSRILEPSKATR
jgi:hypothetical protein